MGRPEGGIYSAGSLIDLGGGRWKCRFSRTKDGRRKQVTRSFEAQGKRAAIATGRTTADTAAVDVSADDFDLG